MTSQRVQKRILSQQDAQVEAERMQDVFLLLDNLTRREEATVKSILACLYDVGSIRWIEQKVPLWPLRLFLRSSVHIGKPAFCFFGWRWFKKNCPRLITEWLYSQVVFQPKVLTPEEDIPLIDVTPILPELPLESLPPSAELPPIVERQAAEINALRQRINWLTVALLGFLVVMGSLAMIR